MITDIPKWAVLSMDVEDWYHLDYFQGKLPNKSYSMLDGLIEYIDFLERNDIKTTFFVLSELIDNLTHQLSYMNSCGHEIACHGKTHKRPLLMSNYEFEKDVTEAKESLSIIINKEVIGYRAPCYSINDEKYNILRKIGFRYSSSQIDIDNHPLYSKLNLTEYTQSIRGIYTKNGFTEFSLNTQKVFNKKIAISGGGWIRILPWKIFMRPIIKTHLLHAQYYSSYIHPFELSKKNIPLVKGISMLSYIRAHIGLKKVLPRMQQIITMLKDQGYSFTTFRELLIWMETQNRLSL